MFFLSIIQEGQADNGFSTSFTASEPRSVEAISLHAFRIIKSLGRGNFGRVELVEHKETKELYAMKLLERQKYSAQRITRFAFSEQYILKTTRHPLIVSLHFAFQTTRHWVMVMEFCPLGNLLDLLAKDGNPGLKLAVCAKVGGEVLLAIEHLHCIRVIFRDIKPDNIVFDADGRAKITDFGLAKKLAPAEDAQTACGTEGYAAPELVTRSGNYTFAVDIYSFGVLLYVILSGGQCTEREPDKRLPPHAHVTLRSKLHNLPSPTPAWAEESENALSLLQHLTKGQPSMRPTATEAKEHQFFSQHLGHHVDDLLDDFRM